MIHCFPFMRKPRACGRAVHYSLFIITVRIRTPLQRRRDGLITDSIESRWVRVNVRDKPYRVGRRERGQPMSMHPAACSWVWCNINTLTLVIACRSGSPHNAVQFPSIISVEARRYQLDDSGYCCLLILGSAGHFATMFVVTPIIMDSHNLGRQQHWWPMPKLLLDKKISAGILINYNE